MPIPSEFDLMLNQFASFTQERATYGKHSVSYQLSKADKERVECIVDAAKNTHDATTAGLNIFSKIIADGVSKDALDFDDGDFNNLAWYLGSTANLLENCNSLIVEANHCLENAEMKS